MKELDNLIEYYNNKAEKYRLQVINKERDIDKAYNNGIAEGFYLARRELVKVNKLIDEKLKALL